MTTEALSRTEPVTWRRLYAPWVMACLAMVVAWVAVWFAFRGHWLGVALPMLATAIGLTAVRQWELLARRRNAALRQALDSAAARNRELERLRHLAATTFWFILPTDGPVRRVAADGILPA